MVNTVYRLPWGEHAFRRFRTLFVLISVRKGDSLAVFLSEVVSSNLCAWCCD